MTSNVSSGTLNPTRLLHLLMLLVLEVERVGFIVQVADR